jgi:hypothetical protein
MQVWNIEQALKACQGQNNLAYPAANLATMKKALLH